MNSVDDVCDFFGEIWGLSKNQKILLKSNVQKLVLDSTATAEADLAKARQVIQGLVEALRYSTDFLYARFPESKWQNLDAALTTARNYLEGQAVAPEAKEGA